MKRVIVKICGITDVDTACFAAGAGADAIGLVFYGRSPRVVAPDSARQIVASLPAHVSSVALFVNENAAEIARVIDFVNPAILQFHGDEEAGFCQQFGKPYWKAIRVNASTDLLNCQRSFAGAARLLLDTSADQPGVYGGSGEMFDWQLIPPAMRGEIILSGGLNSTNVTAAITTIKPWAVDVSSGVEETRGVKSKSLIRQFMNEVLRANV